MLGRRRRLQQLESEVAMARAERAELRQRLAAFEAIAAAVGASDDAAELSGYWPGPVPPAPTPPGLVAAARELRSHDSVVRMDVAGADLAAVVGGPGNPRDWWTAIWQFAGPGSASAGPSASPRATDQPAGPEETPA